MAGATGEGQLAGGRWVMQGGEPQHLTAFAISSTSCLGRHLVVWCEDAVNTAHTQ
jgi:hypothetical protein